MDKVIVVGCGVPGYGAIRAFADKDIYLIALTHEGNFACVSRYSSETILIPLSDEYLLSLLIRNARQWEGALVLETSDYMATALSRNKDSLSRYYRIPTPDLKTLRLFTEKEKTYELAERCQVPYPKTIPLTKLDDLKEISKFRYPCILKPISSFEFVAKFGVKSFKVRNEIELIEKFKLCLSAGTPVLLQEVIPGPDENFYRMEGYVNSQGNLVGKFFCRKMRQHPPHFGVMRVGVSTEPDREVERLTRQLLDPVHYRGYFSLEFKKDPRDGQLMLMENNCRLIRYNLLATASGVNHPWIIYQDLVKNKQIDVANYQVGKYWIELYPDLSYSLFQRNKEDIRLRDYIAPYLSRHKVFAELDFHDLKPFFKITKRRVIDFFHKLLKALNLEKERMVLEKSS